MSRPCQPPYSLITACGPFERAPVLAVAVSGGADSMALLLLADAWAKGQGGRAVALTVDHGLRKESADEAKQVKTWCEKKGIEQHVLQFPLPLREGVRGWGNAACPPPRPSPSRGEGVTQATAREARYRSLTDWCKKYHILHLLTAHHRDDQAETLLFRLGRGSGLAGLACMQAVSHVHGIRLLRPLLGVPKSQLKALLMAAGQPWIEDPSNHSPKYTRNRIRVALGESGLSEQAANLAGRLGHIRAENERRIATVLPHVISIFPDHASLHLENFMALPPEDGLHALSALVMAMNGSATPPRTEKLQRLYAELPTFKRQRSFANLMFIREKQGKLKVKPLETDAGNSHITPMRRPVKPLAGAPFFVLNGHFVPKEGARVLHA